METDETDYGIWCKAHWEEVLQSGADPELICLIMLESLLHNQEFLREIPPPRSEVQLTLALSAITPVCCWLGDPAMAAAFADAWVRAEA